MPSMSFGGGGNHFDQFIDQLIKGLQDGTILPQSVDIRMGGPGAAVSISGSGGAVQHHSFHGPTYYVVEFVDVGSKASLTPHVQAMPGAKTYGTGIKLKSGSEPVTGFRDFELTDTVHGLLLRSRNGAFWGPRERFRALCQKRAIPDHDVPSLDCECGVYAYDTPDHPSLKSGHGAIWGEVAMWGDVLVCDTGFRAEYAYPTAIFIRDAYRTRTVKKIRDELAESYGVPVFLVEKRSGQTSSQMIQEALATFLANDEMQGDA